MADGASSSHAHLEAAHLQDSWGDAFQKPAIDVFWKRSACSAAMPRTRSAGMGTPTRQLSQNLFFMCAVPVNKVAALRRA